MIDSLKHINPRAVKPEKDEEENKKIFKYWKWKEIHNLCK